MKPQGDASRCGIGCWNWSQKTARDRFDIQTVEFGWPLGMPTCRSLGDGLWEVRCNGLTGQRIARVLFCIVNGDMVSAARVHQEDPEDPAKGYRDRPCAPEGDCMMDNDRAVISAETFDEFLDQQASLRRRKMSPSNASLHGRFPNHEGAGLDQDRHVRADAHRPAAARPAA